VIRDGGRSSKDGRHSALLPVLTLNHKHLHQVSKLGTNDATRDNVSSADIKSDIHGGTDVKSTANWRQ
jgi:hypothetical protein